MDSTTPSLVIVGNGSALPVTSVDDIVIPGSFYLNNILFTSDIIYNLFYVHLFTIDNRCSMDFDTFGSSMKGLATKNVIIRSNNFVLL
jgi:hypothetical protein